jgi:hypothetical protein
MTRVAPILMVVMLMVMWRTAAVGRGDEDDDVFYERG